MKQRVLEGARSVVDAFLRKHCADIEGTRAVIGRFLATPVNVRRDFAIHVLMRVRADA